MNTDLNFMVSTEGLSEKGSLINKEAMVIKQAIMDIDEARKSLDGWVSQNKDRYDSKLAMTLPKLNEMVQVIESFGNVALRTSERAINVENKISKAIEEGNIPS